MLGVERKQLAHVRNDADDPSETWRAPCLWHPSQLQLLAGAVARTVSLTDVGFGPFKRKRRFQHALFADQAVFCVISRRDKGTRHPVSRREP